MLITDSQRTALQTLIELTANGRALQFEHDNPKRAEELKELVARHKETRREADRGRRCCGRPPAGDRRRHPPH